MRRILLAVATVAILLASGSAAQARHGHCGWGGGWGGGYRGCGYGYGGGWGGCGYGDGWGCGGWGGGYGGYSSGWCGSGINISVGYRPAYYGGPVYGVPAWYPTYRYEPAYYGIGHYGYYGSTYNPSSNFLAPALAPDLAARPTTPAAELLAALRRPAAVPRISADKPVARISNAEQRRKAEQHLAMGDLLFREQKFHSALQRYKLASLTAPDMAEGFWRQGHALIATGNYQLAGSALKRAIAIDPDPTREGFSLDTLYGPGLIAKTAHIEGLAGWALERGDSSESYFLMAVTLHYDGQGDRAAKFFARAADMAGVAGGHIAVFESAVPPLAPIAATEWAPAAVPAKVLPAKVLPVSAAVEI